MSGQSAAALEFCYDIPRLLQLFEGLGDNCDFGVVQRAVGIEPLGLFRFAACKAADVGALLRTRFQQLGEPEDLWLDEVGPRREYWVKPRQFSFEAHTDRFAGRDDPEVVRSAQIEKTRFLKTRLIRDLSRGRRLCVWRGAADMAAIQEIAAQLQTYAPTCLLWVKVADGAQVPGSVDRVSDRLLLGFLSRYGDYDGGPRLPVVEWISLCAKAYRSWRNAEPPKAPLDNILARTSTTSTHLWFSDLSVINRQLKEPGPTDNDVFEHLVSQSGSTVLRGVLLPINAGGSFVFSAWVCVNESYRGRGVSAVLGGYDAIADCSADPLAFNQWQRIWVTANLPADAREISCFISAEAGIGDIVQSASWCLERGNHPTGYGFTF